MQIRAAYTRVYVSYTRGVEKKKKKRGWKNRRDTKNRIDIPSDRRFAFPERSTSVTSFRSLPILRWKNRGGNNWSVPLNLRFGENGETIRDQVVGTCVLGNSRENSSPTEKKKNTTRGGVDFFTSDISVFCPPSNGAKESSVSGEKFEGDAIGSRIRHKT